MTPRHRIPSSHDVARQAGVSTATVSRFTTIPSGSRRSDGRTGRGGWPKTGYLPNRIAGGLASNRSRLVAVLVPDVAQSIFNDTIEAMISELAVDGHIVCSA